MRFNNTKIKVFLKENLSINHKELLVVFFGLILSILVDQENTVGVLNAMMSFVSIKTRIFQTATTLSASVLLFKSRTFISNPENSRVLLNNLSQAHINLDKQQIYCGWLLCASNYNGLMPWHNLGLISKFAKNFNKEYYQNSPKRLSEKECLDFWGLKYSETSLSTDLRLPYNNLNETLAIEYVNKSDFGFKLQRNYDNNIKIPNLGLQPNNDCIGIMFKSYGTPVCFYIDIKNTTLESAMSKLKLTNLEDKSMFLVQGSGQRFGCNVYIIATSPEKDLVLSLNERSEMIAYLDKMSSKYPEIYQGLKESSGYLRFTSTGNWDDLGKAGFPVPTVVKSQNLVPKEILDVLKASEEYKKLTRGILLEEITKIAEQHDN